MPRNLKHDIGLLVRDNLRTLRISGAGAVDIVKRFYYGTSIDRGLHVVEEAERYERGTNQSEAVGYSFLIVFVRGTTTSSADLDWSDWRRRVREKFHNKKLTGVTEVYVCKVTYADIYLPKPLKQNYEASAVRVIAYAEEVRP